MTRKATLTITQSTGKKKVTTVIKYSPIREAKTVLRLLKHAVKKIAEERYDLDEAKANIKTALTLQIDPYKVLQLKGQEDDEDDDDDDEEDDDDDDEDSTTSEEEEEEDKNYQVKDKQQNKKDSDEDEQPPKVPAAAKKNDSDQEVQPPSSKVQKKKKKSTPKKKKEEDDSPTNSDDDQSTKPTVPTQPQKKSSAEDKKQTKGGIEFYSQYDTQFQNLINSIDPLTFDKACAGSLINLVGRNKNRAKGHGNQIKTVQPYAGSFVHWMFTGEPWVAPNSNPHVKKTDHTNGGANSVHFKIALKEQDSETLVKMVRSLFTATEVQVNKYSKTPYEKLMAIVDRKNCITYLVRIAWQHEETADNIACSIKSFKTAPASNQPDFNSMISKFDALGIK